MSHASSRSQHPYFMYDHMVQQVAAFAEVAERLRSATSQTASRVKAARKLFLIGIGTSYHAARLGGHLMHQFAPEVDCQVGHSFDFVLYGPQVTEADVVVAISHRGAKQFTRQALERGQQAGATTVLITGHQAEAALVHADDVWETVPQERSSAHTVSFVAAVSALSELARQVGDQQTLDADLLQRQVPSALSVALQAEPQMRQWAARYHASRRIWLVGAGPASMVAQEVALKIKETSYLQAEGMGVETLLHGPFQCCEAEDLFVLIAPQEVGQARLRTLAEMVDAVGAQRVAVSDGPWFGARETCVLPSLPAPFPALACLVPLQLFAYHLALQCGTNPDGFRLEDPRFATALGKVQL